MTTQHTPAPWSVEIDHHTAAPEFIRTYVDGEMYDLASVLCDETGNATANARLIAAAPDLLAALKAMDDAFSHYCEGDPSDDEIAALEAARATVAKVRGEQA